MRAWTFTRWTIGIAILGLLVLALDSATIGALLATASLPLVVIGVVGLTSLHLLGAATWRLLTNRIVGRRLEWGSTVRMYYAAQAVGGFTPANVGSDAYRVVALRGTGESLRGAMLPILVQRATSYLAVSLLGALALIFAARPAALTVGVTLGALILSAVVLGTAGLVYAGPGPLGWVRERLIGPAMATDRGMAGAVGIGLALGVLFHVLGIGLTYVLVLAVEPGASTVAALATVAIARVSLLVPLTPSGLGVQEAALTILFVGLGLPAESALAASLLARLSLVLTAAIGAVAMLIPAGRAGAPAGSPPHSVDSAGV